MEPGSAAARITHLVHQLPEASASGVPLRGRVLPKPLRESRGMGRLIGETIAFHLQSLIANCYVSVNSLGMPDPGGLPLAL